MIVTPIHKNPKSKSNMNYREQVQREKDGIQFIWDDTKLNKARVGDFFGFSQNDRMVTFRLVERIEERLPSDGVNVVYLGQIARTMLWEDWIFYGGAKKVNRTMNVKTNVDHLLRYLDQWRE
jgi:hypothetical protein